MNFSIKLKKIVVLGIAIVGVVFFNKVLISNRPELKPGFAIQPLSQGFGLVDAKVGGGGSTKTNRMELMPAPEKFHHFIAPSQAEISGTCADKYYAVLIYEDEFDYRKTPEAARLNRASKCQTGGFFNTVINPKDIGLLTEKYYIIIADQGKEGSWYNPR